MSTFDRSEKMHRLAEQEAKAASSDESVRNWRVDRSGPFGFFWNYGADLVRSARRPEQMPDGSLVFRNRAGYVIGVYPRGTWSKAQVYDS